MNIQKKKKKPFKIGPFLVLFIVIGIFVIKSAFGTVSLTKNIKIVS